MAPHRSIEQGVHDVILYHSFDSKLAKNETTTEKENIQRNWNAMTSDHETYLFSSNLFSDRCAATFRLFIFCGRINRCTTTRIVPICSGRRTSTIDRIILIDIKNLHRNYMERLVELFWVGIAREVGLGTLATYVWWSFCVFVRNVLNVRLTYLLNSKLTMLAEKWYSAFAHCTVDIGVVSMMKY